MKITWSNCFRVGISVFVLYLCIYYWAGISSFLSLLLGALTPVLAGFAIAYVLNILMSFYERHYSFGGRLQVFADRTRRPICLTAAIVTLLAIVALVVGLVVPELISCVGLLISKIPVAVQRLIDSKWVMKVVPQEALASLANIDWSNTASQVVKFLGSGITSAVSTVISVVASVSTAVVSVFLSVIFAIYALANKEKLAERSKQILKRYTKPKWEKKVQHLTVVLNECFRKYIVGQCTEAVILGVLCALGMWAFRFPYATMIGALVGFTALIPVAGAYIGAAVGAVMILTVSPIKALLFLVFILVLQQVEGNLIYPKVVGSSMGLPAFLVLVAVTVGGSLGGILGMLIGVPLTAAVYRLLKEDLKKAE